jgi:cbb3-type cytochrome oxidase subunit 3
MRTAIVIIVVVLLLAAVAAYLYNRRRKQERAQLQERFGPEYDRAVDESGGRRAAEHRLSDAAARRDKAEIRDLTPAERERFTERWTRTQADFVDDPAGAASSADTLVAEVMRERGYPLDDVEDRGDLVAADHADLANHYREAHAIGRRAHEASTEQLRQAFVHYRALFTELLGTPDGRHAVDPAEGDRPRTAPGPQTPPV